MNAAEKNALAPSAKLIALALLTLYIVWGSTYLGIRWAIETIPPFFMGGTRFILAGVLLFIFVRLRGTPLPTTAHISHGVLTGGLLFLGGNGLVNWAEQHVSSGITALLLATTPLWFAFFDWVMPPRRSLSWRTFFGMGLATAGIALLSLHGGAGGENIHVLGLIALLAACVSWSAGSLFSKKSPSSAEPFLAASIQMFSGGIFQLLVSFALGETAQFSIDAVSMRSFLAWGYLVTVGSLIGFSVFIWLMKVCAPERVVTYAYVNPVIAVLLGWLLAGEQLTPEAILGSAIIVVAVVVITTANNNSRLRGKL